MGWLSREKVIGAGMPNGVYLGRYRDPETNAPGPEIWLPWLEMVLIIGRNRSGKDAGILIPNALKREKNLSVSEVFVDTRLEAGTICAPYRRSLGPTLVGNAFNEHASLAGYADLRSDRLNLMKSRRSIPATHCTSIISASWRRRCFRPKAAITTRSFRCQPGALGRSDDGRVAGSQARGPRSVHAEHSPGGDRSGSNGPDDGRAGRRADGAVARLIDEGDPQICSLLGAFAGERRHPRRDCHHGGLYKVDAVKGDRRRRKISAY